MRRDIKQHLSVVQGSDAEDFEKKVNDILDRVDYEATIEIDKNTPYLCYIYYKQERVSVVTIKDEYENIGICLHCKDCMYLERIGDKRIKNLFCTLSGNKVKATASACEMFYRKLANNSSILTEEGVAQMALLTNKIEANHNAKNDSI